VFEELKAEEKREFIINEVLTTPEAIELLGISIARMSAMIRTNKIKPVKKLGCVSLFLKEELIEKKSEMTHLRRKYRPYEIEMN
jgi:hypothetical protein